MAAFETEALAVFCGIVALLLAVAALRPRSVDDSIRRYRNWRRPASRDDAAHDFRSTVTPFTPLRTNPAQPDLSDVGAQLNAIMRAAFEKRRVMNRSEYEVFRIVESEVVSAKKGHRAFAQTSLGQILGSPSNDAFRSINAKRVDILVVDRGGWPVFAVEYQGPGHYQGTAAARDAIKKEALRRAGVGYLEVTENDNEEQLRLRIREHLGVKAPDPTAAAKSSVRSLNPVPQLH